MPNASFDSQAKDTLVTKVDPLSLHIPDRVVKQIMDELGVVDLIAAAVASREQQAMLRQLKKSKAASAIRSIPKLEDANEAGGRRANECTLVLTEGDSAKALAVAGLSVVGRDLYGVFPLRGKVMNVRDLSPKEAIENAEIGHMVSILGLDFNKTYEDPASFDLRYGHVLIMADQDHDGSHIKGLLINLFHRFWPALLKREGFLEQFITPIVKVCAGLRWCRSLAEAFRRCRDAVMPCACVRGGLRRRARARTCGSSSPSHST